MINKPQFPRDKDADWQDSPEQWISELDENEVAENFKSIPADEVDELEEQETRERIAQIRQDREERKKYAERLFWLVVIWLTVIVTMLFVQGVLGPLGYFSLPDSVLIATITSTTASVIAIFAFVAKYLFRRT